MAPDGVPMEDNPRLSEVVRTHLGEARQAGLLNGPPDVTVKARVSAALLDRAKAQTGVESVEELLEIALANLAVEDRYVEWLKANRGTVSPDLDLQFQGL